MPERTFATLDHIIPTTSQARPVRRSARRGDGRAHDPQLPGTSASPCSIVDSGRQGIVHVIGPELGLLAAGHDDRVRRQPHRDARRLRRASRSASARARCATCWPPSAWRWPSRSLRQVRVDGALAPGVYAKDVILTIIRRLGVQGRRRATPTSTPGAVIDRMSMEERMTVCNMSIEGGAPLRLRQSRPDDRRLPAGPAVRAAGRGVRPRGGVVEEHGLRRRMRASTTSARIDGVGDRARP